MDNLRISQCVEQLCQLGCTEVRAVIVKLENNREVGQMGDFSDEERHQVLAELKAIMAVYDTK